MEAARFWARGGPPDDSQALADLLAYGADPAAAKAWLEASGDGTPESFALWACNVPAFSLFMDLRTQWRRSPFGQRIGIDYAALPAVMDLRGIKRKRRGRLFDDLQAMEMAALEVFMANG